MQKNPEYIEEMFKELWVNPTPSSAFAAQGISWTDDDYDFLLFIIKYSDNYQYSVIVKKGGDALIRTTGTTGSGYTTTYQRTAIYQNDKSYSIGQNYVQNSNSTRTTDNNYNYPLAVYGIKM